VAGVYIRIICCRAGENKCRYSEIKGVNVKYSIGDDKMVEIREAKAHYGFRNGIVVNDCPYCGGTHYHSQGPVDDSGQIPKTVIQPI
jgi:hypothetical protein